ncbi:bidirectional sugar transporter N3 [Prunus yedoensis var. nudiflora]|uniref:Bidirectional sugar transporter SWEET n=1 Tax=Prunus yedoensis var. nudiflora TaxID=2094558 RepID=A0A314V098_PRUYE|nr:bidirectional sugar transporter N3 [Prunus yedoensis var. nudiflora]
MTSSSAHSPLVIAFGILGNVVSFVVFLAPVPTFWRVYKKKSTEGFQSVPYVFALFSAMIWIYYAFLKSDEFLLITINAFGCIIETIYILMYITYAPKQARVFALRLLLLVNFGGFCLILLLSHFLAQGPVRVQVLGWVCVGFSVGVFAAPLSIMCPNILGFTFGVAQMILYAIYRNKKTVLVEDQKLPEHKGDVVKQIQILTTTPEVEIQVQAAAVSSHANTDNENCEQNKDKYVHAQTCNTEKIIGPSMPSQMVTCEV